MDAFQQQRGTESDQDKSFCLPQLMLTMLTPRCTLENSKTLWPGWERTPKISLHASRNWWTTARWSMMSIVSMNCITILSLHTTLRESSLGNLWQSHSRHHPASWLILLWTTLPSNMPKNKSPTAPNLWMLSTRTSVKWPTPATTAVVTHHLHPPRTAQLHMTTPSWQSKLPQTWFPLLQMWQDGNWGPKCHGGKPLQPRNAPSPGSQQRKSRCPPRNHNNCHGWGNKTDAIDVSEDHSPQDEIALHYIQPNATVRNTHPNEIMVRDVHAPWCNKAYTTIQLPASASRKGTALLHVKVDTRVGGNVLPLHVFWCLYPDQISPAGLPTDLDHIITRLTTYNGSHIPLYGTLCGPITWQPDHPGAWPHRVNSYWYIADTPGLTILGLPSSEKLAVVNFNCAIMVRQPSTHPAPVSTTVATTKPATAPEAAKSIRSTDDFIKELLG